MEAGRIKGIGSGLLEAIRELLDRGEYSLYEDLKAGFPEGFLDLLELPGLGPKKLRVLRDELGIENIEGLIKACEQNRLVDLKGFSEKTQTKLKEGAEKFLLNQEKFLLPEAEVEIVRLCEDARLTGGKNICASGDFRRFLPIVSELRISVDESPSELLFSTGSQAHVELLQQRAEKLGYSLSAQALRKKGGPLPLQSEEELYKTLKLAYIPPELREGREEIELAAKLYESGQSEFPLLEKEDIQGVLHAHSTYSDGSNSIREMVQAAKELGYHYLGISDHSQSAAYARGLKPPIIEKQRREIEEINAEVAPFRVFHGIESDILSDGSLDYSDDILARFDFIVASVHSRFSLDREAMTKRLVKAVQNPYTTILGHSSGRKLLEREPYDFDVEAVLLAAKECGTAVEINANPRRLDLDWSYLSHAKELGIQIPICPDAHSVQGIKDIRWGVAIARKGGLTKDRVLNTRSAAGFEQWCRDKRARV